ncbi:MAG: sugar transferase [Flavitalea sp.]
MELGILPHEKNLKKTYRHFTINAQPVVEPAATKSEFFYIGKKSPNIDHLINSFESGYAAENVEHAKSMLHRLVTYSKNTPSIIIVEAACDYNTLSDFYHFVTSNSNLSNVPFVIEGSGLSKDELQRYRKYPFIDEIIFLADYNKQTLHAKVNFLNKVKQRVNTVNPNRHQELCADGVRQTSLYIKRIFDIIISAVLLVVFSPLFLLIIAAIKLESKGPVFYIAKRAGRGYKIFDFYKFRTMFVGADQKILEISHMNQYSSQHEGPMFLKINNDPRVTRVGAFLRNTSLDELPQLVNVLKGDMSLVGNRPLPLYEAASLTTDEWAKRFMAPAGITGLWQIKKRGREEMSVEERISLDINYADKNNFLYDLWIMANTPTALIQKTNA